MSEKCKLDTEDIPPLSELDHLQKNCFCYLCNCGQHKCPSLNPYHRQSPKLVSSYKQKFSGKQATPPKPFAYINEILSSKQKMELKSTTKEDFKAIPADSFNKTHEYRYRSVSPFRFNATSTYNNNYIDYGPVRKGPNNRKKSDFESLKFIANSTYAQNFVKHGKLQENFDKGVKRWNILGAGGISILETTNNKMYKMPKELLMSKPYIHTSLEQISEANSPQLRSTYANSFLDISKKDVKPTMRQIEKFL